MLEGAWERGADAPVALTEVAVAAHDDRIWVAGGLTAEGAGSTDVFVYDPAADTWTEGPDLPGPVHHSALVSDGEALRLVGGYAGNGFDTPTDDVWRLDPTAPRRGSPTSRCPSRAAAGAAAWDGSRIVYAGGVGTGWRVRRGVRVRGRGVEPGRAAGEPASTSRRRRTATGGRTSSAAASAASTRNLATADLVRGTTAETIGELPTRRGGVAAFWWPTLGACLVGGESPGGTNPQVECIDEDGDVAVLPAWRTHATGWVPRSSMAWPTSCSAATSRAVRQPDGLRTLELPDDRVRAGTSLGPAMFLSGSTRRFVKCGPCPT